MSTINTTESKVTSNKDFINSIIEQIKLVHEIYDLNKIRFAIDKQKENIETENIISQFKSEIEIEGYYLSNKLIKIPDINTINLKFYVKVRAYDHDEQDDAEIIRSHDNQDLWVDLLGFEYDATENDILEDYIGEWEGSSSTDPLYAKGYIHIYLYYKDQILPSGKFKVINEDGKIEDWKHKDDMIMIDEVSYGIDGTDIRCGFIIPSHLVSSDVEVMK